MPRSALHPASRSDDRPHASAPARREAEGGHALLRPLLLALVLMGTLGLAVELFLLGHTESTTQFVPFAALALALVATVGALARPGRRTIRLFQGVMLLCVAAGVTGLVLHYRGNVEFELEMHPERRGLELFWKAVRGATPALAPGALAQLGLLGLVAVFRHPLLRPLGARGTTEESGS